MLLKSKFSYLIVCLGNPGIEYRETRHNIGFMVADALARQHQGTFENAHLRYSLARLKWHENHLLLMKPITYMNLSGLAVQNAVMTYRICTNRVLVVYDDVHLSIGRLRIRKNGSDGGQKGLRSILETMGTKDIARLRIGVGDPGKSEMIEYVLSPFSEREIPVVQKSVQVACQAIMDVINNGLDYAMNFYNGLNCQ